MTEIDLRALVREAVARHVSRGGRRAPGEPDPWAPLAPAGADPRAADARTAHQPGSDPRGAAASYAGHPSHAVYLTVVNAGEACVIEPSVPCDHCGYCRSHGH